MLQLPKYRRIFRQRLHNQYDVNILGSLQAGGSTTQTIYVKNTGTGTLTLELSPTNWTPVQASTYITISWDKQGTQLSAGQSTQATVTITVSSSITGITNFSNTISISGTS